MIFWNQNFCEILKKNFILIFFYLLTWYTSTNPFLVWLFVKIWKLKILEKVSKALFNSEMNVKHQLKKRSLKQLIKRLDVHRKIFGEQLWQNLKQMQHSMSISVGNRRKSFFKCNFIDRKAKREKVMSNFKQRQKLVQK